MGHTALTKFVLAAWMVPALLAQLPGSSSGGSSRAMPLPQSGRGLEPGSVTVEQSVSSNGVDTVNASVQASGDFAGSVPAQNVPQGAITLTLADAVKRGLEANLGMLTASYTSRTARAQRIQALSVLLPNINIGASETVTQINLAAYGFQFKIPPSVNFSIPSVVGPFSYSQLQGSLAMPVYDAVERRNWRAAQESEHATELTARDARELVVLAVAGSYLQTVATAARIESQKAQLANAEAVNHQADVRKSAGTNSRIDVMRTLVEVETQQQRLNSLTSDLRKQKIGLARLIGLPLDRELILSEPLTASVSAAPAVDSAVQSAFQKRPDLRAAEAQVHAADLALSAAHAERLPSASLNGDYGVLGPNPTSMHGVFAVTGSVNFPVWQGGRVRGDIEQAEAALHQRQAELADLRGQVEQEVRTALIELETAIGQVKLAEANRGYANETLREARDRANLGVATTVEVVQAQEQVAGAESDYISSLFALDLARLTLARTMGEAETGLPELMRPKS